MKNFLNDFENKTYQAMLDEAWVKATNIYGEDFYKRPGQFRLKKEGGTQYLEWSPGYDCSGMG